MLMCALLIAVPVTTESASAAVATNRTAKAKISGWVTVQNGEKKYYKKGQYLKAVSYTHLDVYKRQVPRCSTSERGLRFTYT